MKHLNLILLLFLISGCNDHLNDSDDTIHKDKLIKAFCIDFNWGPDGFAPPGMFNQADPREHLKWYNDLGVNTIQTFCVSTCGYAWYRSKVAPVQPQMKGDFLNELTELAHKEGIRVMGYFCIGANTWWGENYPELSYGTPSTIHIPLTQQYIDYLCTSIRDALLETKIDGFMMDWFYSPPYDRRAIPEMKWMACERQMYQELFGEPFPGKAVITAEKELEFHRRAISRCWKQIRKTVAQTRPDCIVWLSCCAPHDLQIKGLDMLSEVDWIMNENYEANQILAMRPLVPETTQLIQCLCGWGPRHDAERMIANLADERIGFYGFARPDTESTLPPTDSDDPRLAGNAKNIAIMKDAFSRY